MLISCVHCWDSRELSQELLGEFSLYILIFCVLCCDCGKLSEELIEAVFFSFWVETSAGIQAFL